jgi:hypothetical protein
MPSVAPEIMAYLPNLVSFLPGLRNNLYDVLANYNDVYKIKKDSLLLESIIHYQNIHLDTFKIRSGLDSLP